LTLQKYKNIRNVRIFTNIFLKFSSHRSCISINFYFCEKRRVFAAMPQRPDIIIEVSKKVSGFPANYCITRYVPKYLGTSPTDFME